MRTPSVAVVACVALAAACSRSKPVDRSKLDLALPDYTRPGHVASALEIWGKDKPTAAAPAHTGVDAPQRAHRKAPTHKLALVPKRVRGPEHAPLLGRAVQPTIAVAPTPAPRPVPAPAPSEPQPTDPQPDHGRGGGFPAPNGGGIHFPGFPGGGVIIIRGGHGGMDPCDEHGHGGIFPGLPGRMGGGRWGGIRF